MVVVGLTGGIATGKSTVTAMFAALGATTLSADDDARFVLSAGSPVLNDVCEAFPSAAMADGGVDRPALATSIFTSPEERRRLEAIMHPTIETRIKEAIRLARMRATDGVLVYEVPLLFENSLGSLFDFTIAVVASAESQERRLQIRESAAGRPPLSTNDIAGRLAAQLPSETKAHRADFVIHNDGTLDATRKQAATILTAIALGKDPH